MLLVVNDEIFETVSAIARVADEVHGDHAQCGVRVCDEVTAVNISTIAKLILYPLN